MALVKAVGLLDVTDDIMKYCKPLNDNGTINFKSVYFYKHGYFVGAIRCGNINPDEITISSNGTSSYSISDRTFHIIFDSYEVK